MRCCYYCGRALKPVSEARPGSYSREVTHVTRAEDGVICRDAPGGVHVLALPWFEVRAQSEWANIPGDRDLVIHYSEHHASSWKLNDSALLQLLAVLTEHFERERDPVVRARVLRQMADAMRYLRDSTPVDPGPGYHRRQEAERLTPRGWERIEAP